MKSGTQTQKPRLDLIFVNSTWYVCLQLKPRAGVNKRKQMIITERTTTNKRLVRGNPELGPPARPRLHRARLERLVDDIARRRVRRRQDGGGARRHGALRGGRRRAGGAPLGGAQPERQPRPRDDQGALARVGADAARGRLRQPDADRARAVQLCRRARRRACARRGAAAPRREPAALRARR